MAELVAREDVEAVLLRSLTTEEEQFLPTLIDQASALLRAALPTLDARMALTPGTNTWIDPDLVASVLARVIKRVIINPTGASSSSTTDGPFSRTVGWAGSNNKFGELVITAEDLQNFYSRPAFSRVRSLQLSPTQAMQPRSGWWPRGVPVDPITGEPLYDHGWLPRA